MSVGSVIQDLDILMKAQEIDEKLYEAEVALQSIPVERAKLKSELDSEKTQLLALEDGFKKLQLKQKSKEGELEQKENQIKKLDGQLSQVKTNKEYTALQQEMASLKADNSLIEEEVIKVLDEIDALREEVKKEQERFKKCEGEHRLREETLAQNEKSMNENCKKFRAERDEIIAQLNPKVKDLYLKILQKKSGKALAKVKGQVCSACQMQLRPQLLNEIMLRQQLILCENCSRILYIESEAVS